MSWILVRHKVEDYVSWKPGFDDHSATRQMAGSRGGFVFRNADDPSEVLVLMEWSDHDNARKFAQSDDLREKMQEVGVMDQPDIFFLDEADRPTI